MVPQTTPQPIAGNTSPGAVGTQQSMTQPSAQPGTTVVATGVPPKKSIFKKWWFWLIVVLVLGGLGTGGWFLFS